LIAIYLDWRVSAPLASGLTPDVPIVVSGKAPW
jgi:hypothetical protein